MKHVVYHMYSSLCDLQLKLTVRQSLNNCWFFIIKGKGKIKSPIKSKHSGMNAGIGRRNCLYKLKIFSPLESTVLEKFIVTNQPAGQCPSQMYCMPSACQPGAVTFGQSGPYTCACCQNDSDHWYFSFFKNLLTFFTHIRYFYRQQLSSCIYATCSAELVGREKLVDREYSAAQHFTAIATGPG